MAANMKPRRKAFSGDFERELPKGKMEPYRLWFEYLKFALQEPSHKVDMRLYEPWHDVLNSDFDEWWVSHWKPLFTVPASVSLITSHEAASAALADVDAVVVRVSRRGGRLRVEKDIKKLLKTVTGAVKSSAAPKPLFSLTSKRSINYAALRAMLKLLQLLRQHKYIEDATEAYCSWAGEWNAQRKANDWNRPDVFIPSPLTTFRREIESHRAEQSKSTRRVKQSPTYNNARSDVGRLVKKGKSIVGKVERGIFPGAF
jgi:hypothetical protein